MLAQLALTAGDFEAAERHAAAGLAALQTWGTAWDKRIEWAGWMAWARIELQNARAPLAGEPGRAQRAGTGGMTYMPAQCGPGTLISNISSTRATVWSTISSMLAGR